MCLFLINHKDSMSVAWQLCRLPFTCPVFNRTWEPPPHRYAPTAAAAAVLPAESGQQPAYDFVFEDQIEFIVDQYLAGDQPVSWDSEGGAAG